MAAAQIFPFRYGLFRPVLSVVGAGPAFSSIVLDGDVLRVRMGWSFKAEIPRRSVTGARPSTRMVGGIGVHGWRGGGWSTGRPRAWSPSTSTHRRPDGCWACRSGCGSCA